MQIYADKNICRLFLMKVISVCALSLVLWTQSMAHEVYLDEKEDSVYQVLNRSSGSFSLLSYEVYDFDESKEVATHFVQRYSPGAITVRDGEESEVRSWIEQVEQSYSVPPLFICQLTEIFTLPFKTIDDWPIYLEIESLRSDSLVYVLGETHGRLLLEIGFDMVYLDWIPDYPEKEKKKMYAYLDGLNKSGIGFSLGTKALSLAEVIGWDRVQIVDAHLYEVNKKIEKSRSAFRKDKKYTGLIVEEYLPAQNISTRKNQLTRGAGMIKYGVNDSNQVIEWYASLDMSKVFYKRALREYSKIWKGVKSTEETLREGLSSAELTQLTKQIRSESKVLLSDDDSLVPLTKFNGETLITVSKNSDSRWAQLIDYHQSGEHLEIDELRSGYIDSLVEVLPAHSLFIVDLFQVSGYDEFLEIRDHLLCVEKRHHVILLSYANLPYTAELVDFKEVLWSPRMDSLARFELLDIVLGTLPVSGVLPSYFGSEEIGAERMSTNRLRFFPSLSKGINRSKLSSIDSIVHQSIQNEEMPGCQVVMVKSGEVVYQKSFGFHTYDSLKRVEWNHLYDIASVSKVVGTLPSVMRETQNGYVKLDSTMGYHLPYYQSSNKSEITIKNLLIHQSGLKSYHPFWRNAAYDSASQVFYYKRPLEMFTKSYELLPVNWKDSVRHWIAHSNFNRLMEPDSTFRYLYSDIGFMVLQDLVESRSGQSLDEYVGYHFLSPLGMSYTYYNPLSNSSLETIPTEDDQILREHLLDGHVHDRNAALLGGVSGHAGLFSNATDLAKYMQMMLDDGEYAGRRYFQEDIVNQFTHKPDSKKLRALGWDKPSEKRGNCSQYASPSSFGHSGFTGTLVWADPVHDLIFVFLSNRVHPDANNYKLIRSNTRTRIHDIVYESFLSNHGTAEKEI